MKYRVRHRTTYGYANSVDLAAHMLHLRPRILPYQHVLSTSIQVSPPPVRETESVDHFGNVVNRIFIDRPHTQFEVNSEALVSVGFPRPPEASATAGWETVAALASDAVNATEAAEYLFDSPMVPLLDASRDYAAMSFPPGAPVFSGLRDLTTRIRRDFSYRPGTTTIGTSVARVIQRREGVCQDFAHLMISGLRGLGLPARYVSGYLRTRPAPGKLLLRGADQSHAWVSAWTGPAFGWIDFDPTNDLLVQEDHVVLAWGRDFSDVSPVRGVILGGGRHSLSVGVELSAL